MKLPDMIPGKKYSVLHRIPGGRYPRRSLMRLLEVLPDCILFDARPVAGTVTLPKTEILEVTPVVDDAQIIMNVTVRR